MKAGVYDQYAKIHQGELEAYHVDGDFRVGQTPEGSWWNISDGGYCIAEMRVSTTRKVTPAEKSLSGYTHVSIITQVRLTLRLGYRSEYTLVEPFVYYGGPRAAIRKMMETLQDSEIIWVHARLDLEAELRKAGRSEWELLEAWDADEKRSVRNLWQLLHPAED